MKRLIVIFAFLLVGLLLAACGGPAPASAVEAPASSPTPPPIPTAAPAADSGQPAAEQPAAPPDEPVPPAEQPTAEPPPAEPPTADPSTYGTSAVDALAQDYVSCVEIEPHPIGQQIASTYDVPYEEVMKLFCNGDTFDDILIAYQTRDLTSVGVAELLDMNAAAGSWDAVWQQLGLLDQ